MNQPKVSIISINYNQTEVTCDMLESLRSITWKNVEVIVVDNASSADCSIIAERFPEVKLIRSKVNLGFAGGNNLAIREANGDYFLLLNNDTIVTPGFIEPMIESFQNHPKAGIVSPKIIFYYTDNLVQYAGTSEISPLSCRGETIGYMQKDSPEFSVEYKTNLAHGACMMISKAVIDSVGVLDESYFMYYEEFDFCERVKNAGFEIYFNGKGSIQHKQSVSSGINSPFKTYYMTRNRIFFSRKNFHGKYKAMSLIFLFCVALPKNFMAELLKGRWQNSKAIVRGLFWNFSH